MIELDNRTSLCINSKLLTAIADILTKKDIELVITTKEEIQSMNSKYRNIDKSTDVLSFPYEDMPFAPLGSIVVSAYHVEEKAKEFSHAQEDELALLFIHGLLHLLGYDHETDTGEMREKEKNIIEKFNLPDSLIIRTQG